MWHFMKARVVTPDGKRLEHVRFLFKNGIAAVWKDDADEKHSTRLLRMAPVNFVKRRRRAEPHLVIENSGQPNELVYQVFPIQSGGCNCHSPMKTNGLTYDDLLSEGLTTF